MFLVYFLRALIVRKCITKSPDFCIVKNNLPKKTNQEKPIGTVFSHDVDIQNGSPLGK